MAAPVCLPKESQKSSCEMTNAELDRLAAEELLKEAKTLAKIASVEGALGWKKRRVMRTNKIFLQQTIKRTVNSNKRNYVDRIKE